MQKKEVRKRVIKYLKKYDEDGTSVIATKFSNITGKTAAYNVPNSLFQQRTRRSNRVLLPWKSVLNNGLTFEQLESFSNGVAIDFVNDDYFKRENHDNPTFIQLIQRIGSNENVSAIISIKSEDGNPSSALQRECFDRLLNNTQINYRGQTITINKNNYRNYIIHANTTGRGSNKGNDKWDGFLYISIRGGQQDILQLPEKNNLLFNPACEYANEDICDDLDLVMAYFALRSIDTKRIPHDIFVEHNDVKVLVEHELRRSEYNSRSYVGRLYDYCVNHPSILLGNGSLVDPIQFTPITIEHFKNPDDKSANALNFAHDEAVNLDRFYWDVEKECVLSPSRPTNVFWETHLSNMMQQDFSLDGYFEHLEEMIERRDRLLNR